MPEPVITAVPVVDDEDVVVDDEPVEVEPIEVEPIEEEADEVEAVMVRGLDGEPKPVAPKEPVEPDEALVATMECEPVDAGLLAKVRSDFGTPTRSVQVEVGEGIEEGETWWIVVLDSPADDAYQWDRLRSFLTNAPAFANVSDPEVKGTWISLLGKPWKRVDWDSERLVRAQSALTKAEGCLAAEG